MGRPITVAPPSAPSVQLAERNRAARHALMDYRARLAEDGAEVVAGEAAVWDQLERRIIAAEAAADTLAAEVDAREWALAELERIGVPQPVKISAAELGLVADA